jgi:hypothetical protein
MERGIELTTLDLINDSFFCVVAIIGDVLSLFLQGLFFTLAFILLISLFGVTTGIREFYFKSLLHLFEVC